jgi:alkanesulfonate monooxygenase SsuD/methylene tetrahydromethanopterin reductase-like flavin-dependent oxidoreductase (luciferase family)
MRALGIDAGLDPGLARELAARCQGLGYHSLWSNDDPGGPGLETLAHFAAGAPGLELGVGVLPLQRYEPATIAADVERLGLDPARLWLGIGSGTLRPQIDPLRRAVEGLRELLPEARVVVAAMRPRLCRLGGEIADGVLLNWIPPEAVAASIEHLKIGAQKADRTLDGFEIASFVRTCVTDDPAAARETLARDITGYATVDVYASFFKTAGYPDEVAQVGAAWSAGDRSGAVKKISWRMLDGLGVVGDEAFCRARIAEFAASGLTQPVIVPFAPPGADKAALLRTLRAFA